VCGAPFSFAGGELLAKLREGESAQRGSGLRYYWNPPNRRNRVRPPVRCPVVQRRRRRRKMRHVPDETYEKERARERTREFAYSVRHEDNSETAKQEEDGST